MKTKFVTCILSLFIFIVGLSPTVSMGQATPTIGGDMTPDEYNRINPMPVKLEAISSVEELKSDVLRRVRSGILRMYGSHVSETENDGFQIVEGSSPQDILMRMSETNLQIWMPDPNQSLTITAELVDDEGYGVAQGYSRAKPVQQDDGTYVINSHVTIELYDWQELRGVTGDIESAAITNIDEYGNANTQQLHVWNNRFTVPMSMLEKKGYLMVVRREPTGNGGTRSVAYGYDLLTGQSHLLTPASWNTSFSVNNYYETTDRGMPLFLNGSIVPILAEMRVIKQREPNGVFLPQSQPVTRIEVTVPRRIVFIWIGLHDGQNGKLHEYGHSLKVKNSRTGAVTMIPTVNGYAQIALDAGSYDLMYHLDSFDTPIPSRG